MSATILGVGTAVPHSLISTQQFIEHAKRFCCSTARQERVLEELYRRTEIATRSSVLASASYGERGERIFLARESHDDCGPTTSQRMDCYRQEVSMLAQRAAQQAIETSQVAIESITHLVSVSCTGFHAPGFDIDLIRELGLSADTQRTHVGFMGCHGAMNGLHVARAIVSCEPDAVVLLCSAELCSLHFQYGWSTDKLVANSLFSDGAAALIVAGEMSGGTAHPYVRHIASGSTIVPETSDAMMWRIGDHGFQMSLDTHVPDTVESTLPGWLLPWLAKRDLTVSDISNWIVHPGGPRILDAVEQSLSLPDDALSDSRQILSQCGNMSSPTVLFILQRLLEADRTGMAVMLGFGPGLTIEAGLLELM